MEVNPFYTGEKSSEDLLTIINALAAGREAHIRTHDGDPVAPVIPWEKKVGALTMEYKNKYRIA
ncbi:MAG: hypothetical protein ACUVQ0_02335 [Thermoproteota archaeon]